MLKQVVLVVALVFGAGCSGGGEEGGTLSVGWTFETGDCASNAVETVNVSWALAGGDADEADFACAAGTGDLGEIAQGGGTYAIQATGFDAGGVARARSYGQTTTFSQAAFFPPIGITLHPATAAVIVSWNIAGSGPCPPSVILPFHVALYRPPAAAGGALTDRVTELQVGCSSGEATLMDVAPGDYIVEVDSRAVTPAVRGTAPLTVLAGEDAAVSLDL